jgi:hypothetical protein
VLVTAVGTVDQSVEVTRLLMGPDVQQLVLGPEGYLGVIKEALLRVRLRRCPCAPPRA